MQRYILMRAIQALVTLFFVSMLIFWLARLSGDPLDVMLPMEASAEDYARARKQFFLKFGGQFFHNMAHAKNCNYIILVKILIPETFSMNKGSILQFMTFYLAARPPH